MKHFDYEKYLRNNPLLKEASLGDILKPLTLKLESMGYEVDYDSSFGFPVLEAFKTLPDKSILRMYLAPSEEELQQKTYGGRGQEFSTIDVSFTYWTQQIVKRFFGLVKTKGDYDMQDLPDESGKNIDLGTGMFDIPVEQSVDRVISLVKRAEAKVSPMQTRPMDLDTQGE